MTEPCTSKKQGRKRGNTDPNRGVVEKTIKFTQTLGLGALLKLSQPVTDL
ncbi:hypothetical protein C5167_004409 [Papaver somniferum]|uniref:Uncharacterized protein n=1 Tax=Papaver somniferum TaxID=3469 RepID=A0A4Y7J9E6_PAPSO|nr:hypothetical protein C5167_004409 [Papaver somniferum]